MFNIVIFGPPGAGKGTQSFRIATRYQLKHISTGEILREEIRKGSNLGVSAAQYMERGELVPDEMLIEILRRLIEENRYINGFVFDGYPRTLIQAEVLDEVMVKEGICINLVLSLEVNEEELVARLSKRAEDQFRSDDRPEVIHQRLITYHKQTAPLLDYFKKQGKLVSVMGIGSIDDISEKLYNEIDTAYP